MNYKYQDDGSDPGLNVLPYDSEYETSDYTSAYDDFGERISTDDDDYSVYDEPVETEEPAEVGTGSSKLEDGFGETLRPDNPYLADQLDDEALREAAESDYEDQRADYN